MTTKSGGIKGGRKHGGDCVNTNVFFFFVLTFPLPIELVETNFFTMASFFPRSTFRTISAFSKAAPWCKSPVSAPLAQPLVRRFLSTAQEQPRLRLGATGLLPTINQRLYSADVV
jgi:hypothetical protein